MNFRRLRFIGLLLALAPSVLFAETQETDPSWFSPTNGSTGPRNVFWRPLVSFVLPGFDQYLAGHYTSGLVYSSIWLGAGIWTSNRLEALQDAKDGMQFDRWTRTQRDDFINHEELPRQATLASQYITAVGAMSAWHAFRTAAETQKSLGRYEFLRHEETPMDLLRAPFDFSYLSRSTTWIPFLIAAGVGVAGANFVPEKYQRDPYSSSDGVYASALSYNAGVSEEALFRGYLQPVFYESWGSSIWSNAAQAVIFGLAHRSTIDRPFAQVGMGYYLGWLQQRNDWTLGEGIFIHAWWDVIALSSSYLTRLKEGERAPPPIVWLPGLTIGF